jgi:hypothetical protein
MPNGDTNTKHEGTKTEKHLKGKERERERINSKVDDDDGTFLEVVEENGTEFPRLNTCRV